MQVIQASLDQLNALAAVFDQYRLFYEQPSDLVSAQEFLEARFHNQDSVIFVAIEADQIAGFTQLYPSFSSVSMRRIWILNDLFVQPNYRRQGVAKLLLTAAEHYARQTGAIRIALSTQISNTSAQALYESLGYTKDTVFYHYALQL